MLRMQEQARHHRVDANRQDPAQPRICVPTINIRGNSYRMREHQDWLRAATEKRREGIAR